MRKIISVVNQRSSAVIRGHQAGRNESVVVATRGSGRGEQAYDPSTDRAIVPPPALRRCTLSDGRTFIARLGPIRLLASESVLWSVAWPFGAAEEQVIAMSDCRPRWDDPAVKTR